MRNPKEILVTTTSNIEGLSIKQYIKPISAHVVAGTNFFSDFFASFSDVFGGRSQSYQRQLSSIYSEAVEILKRSAYELGANCILGLKVDLDEISGKGKSMFMITATGTAVIIENLNKTQSKVNIQERIEVISSDKMIELRKRKKIIQLAIDNKLELDDSNWEFLSENSVFEISSEILEKVSTVYESMYEGKEKIYQQLLTYLLSLSEEDRTILLYNSLISSTIKSFKPVIYKLIKELMIFDPTKIKQYLLDTDDEIKRKFLQIVVNDKPFYTKEDISIYENLVKIIESNFTKTGVLTKQKMMLSSKEKEIWICQCGTKNDIDIEYCTKCNKDIYGYFSGQINPELAIKKLKENIELIKNNVA